MSYIVSFRIDNLAGREEPLALKLKRDTNIIFGMNGSGKTSLLKILHSAMSNDTTILRNVPFTAAEVCIYSQKWKKVFTKTIKKPKLSSVIQDKSKRFMYLDKLNVNEMMLNSEMPFEKDGLAWKCMPLIPSKASSVYWAHQYLPTTRISEIEYPWRNEHVRGGHMWPKEDELDAAFARIIEQLWSRYSAQVLGIVREAQAQGLASILREVLSPKSKDSMRNEKHLAPREAYERVKTFLERQGSPKILGPQKEFEILYAENGTLYDIVQDIDSVEDKIEAAMSSRNKIQELVKQMYAKNKEIKFNDESIEIHTRSGERIGLAALSSGEKHLLRIFVQSLFVNDSTMMIDEPELSMHVDWQKSLIRSIRVLSSDAQLIFATHSPEIMAEIPDDRIFNI